MTKTKRNIIVGLVVLFIVVCIGIFNLYQTWGENYYFGKITHIRKDSITIDPLTEQPRIFLITEDTLIKEHGKENETTLEVGRSVIVVSKVREDGPLEARMIKVVTIGKR